MLSMFAIAVMQTVIAVTALVIGTADVTGSSIFEIIAVNGFFITLFVVAASLFSYAAKARNEP